jgi:predicted nucleic acid-binding protein
MPETYYLDTCIWIDHLEDRLGYEKRPLGEYASKLFMKLIKNKDEIIFSNALLKELRVRFAENEIQDIITITSLLIEMKKIDMTKEDPLEADKISKEREIPFNDALHAIIARNNKAILVSQDKHFQELKDIVTVRKPEDII